MANRWVTLGDEVSLITYLKEEDFFPLDERVVRIRLTTGQTRSTAPQRIVSNLARLLRLRWAIRSQRPDVVLSFIDRTNVTTLLAVRGLGIPVVVSERVDPSQETLPPIWSRLRSRTYPRADAVVTQTHAAARWVQEACPGASMVVVPNPVPVVAGSQMWTADRAGPIVLGIGRLHPQKGFDVLIRAFSLCRSEHPEWRVEILGEGESRQELEALISELGLADTVSMPGSVTDVLGRLQRAGIFVLSSQFEGFPNALLEAMAVGVPTISTSCRSGPTDIVEHMRNGLLVPVADVRVMSAALHKLMGDPALRAQLASNTSEVAHRLGEESVFQQWDELVRRAGP